MFQIINPYVNYGRIKSSIRTHMIDQTPGSPVVFSWGARSDHANSSQSECRITLSAPGIDFDSGWIRSAVQEYTVNGLSLPEGEPIRFCIQIKDEAGYLSEPLTDVIYNAHTQWKAGWIRAEDTHDSEVIYLRRDIRLGRPLASAVLYACGIGYQKIYINGEPIDDACLDPAHTDYSKTNMYVMYPELQSRFEVGANCLGIQIADGWRSNIRTNSVYGNRSITFAGPAQFTCMLRLTYIDGTIEWIYSDESFECGFGGITGSDLFNGESWDANRSCAFWNLPGFTGYSPAHITPAPGGVMKPMLLDPILPAKSHSPIASWPIDENRMILDFGQNIAGIVRLRLPELLQSGQVITLRYSEELDENGTLYTLPLRDARVTDTYTASGDNRDVSIFMPLFTYHGFRYIEVSGLGNFDPALAEAVELHTDLDTRSSFRCGDALITRIHEICVATERANQHSILTDCPQRDERMGWMNDATVRFEETPYNFDISRMFPKLIGDLVDAQNADGAITCTAPFVYGNQPADPVCSSFLIAGVQTWLQTGNKALLAEVFDPYCAWENCLLHNSTDFIVNYSYYADWAGPAYACQGGSMGDGAVSAVTPPLFISTGYSYYNCVLLKKIAGILEKPEQENYWAAMAEKIRTAILNKWYDKSTAVMASGSQGCQAFTLWLGLLDNEDVPRAAKVLHDDLVRNEYRFTTGNLCTRYLMDVLSRYGYLEDAYTIITRQEYPSFGYMIQQEATTVWERFELKKNPGMNSHCHPMYGAVDYWFYAYLCGIQATAPGYASFRVEPYYPNKLMSAQATLDTPRGDICVRWMVRYGKRCLHVTVPFGCRATIVFNGQEHIVGSGFHAYEMEV